MSDMDVIPEAALPEGANPVALHAAGAGAACAPGAAAGAAGYARQRNRRVFSSVLTALLTKPLSLLAPLVTAPLFLRYLGREGYGLFEAIVAMSALLAVSNAGLTLGLINRLMDCHVSGDLVLARRYVSSLMIALAALIAIAAGAWSLASLLVHWNSIFKTTDPRFATEIPWVVWVTGVCTLVGLLVTMPVAIYSAYQEIAIANVWDGAAKLATFLACVAVVYTRFGLLGVAVASTGVPLLIWGSNTVWLFRRRPWLRPRLSCFDLKLVRSTIADGIFLLLIQMSVQALFSCDRLIIGAAISPAAVTEYALVGRLFISAYGLFMILLTPLWPAHGEALRRGDWPWVRRGLRLSTAAGFTLCSTCGIVLLLFGDTVFRLWTRGQITHVSPNLVLAMTAMFVMRVWVDCRSVILNSANVLLPQVYFFVAHALLNLALALLLARRYGVVGVAWATPITALLTSAWGYPWMLSRQHAKAAAAAKAVATTV